MSQFEEGEIDVQNDETFGDVETSDTIFTRLVLDFNGNPLECIAEISLDEFDSLMCLLNREVSCFDSGCIMSKLGPVTVIRVTISEIPVNMNAFIIFSLLNHHT